MNYSNDKENSIVLVSEKLKNLVASDIESNIIELIFKFDNDLKFHYLFSAKESLSNFMSVKTINDFDNLFAGDVPIVPLFAKQLNEYLNKYSIIIEERFIYVV